VMAAMATDRCTAPPLEWTTEPAGISTDRARKSCADWSFV
jgi:hypothetical protein